MQYDMQMPMMMGVSMPGMSGMSMPAADSKKKILMIGGVCLLLGLIYYYYYYKKKHPGGPSGLGSGTHAGTGTGTGTRAGTGSGSGSGSGSGYGTGTYADRGDGAVTVTNAACSSYGPSSAAPTCMSLTPSGTYGNPIYVGDSTYPGGSSFGKGIQFTLYPRFANPISFYHSTLDSLTASGAGYYSSDGATHPASVTLAIFRVLHDDGYGGTPLNVTRVASITLPYVSHPTGSYMYQSSTPFDWQSLPPLLGPHNYYVAAVYLQSGGQWVQQLSNAIPLDIFLLGGPSAGMGVFPVNVPHYSITASTSQPVTIAASSGATTWDFLINKIDSAAQLVQSVQLRRRTVVSTGTGTGNGTGTSSDTTYTATLDTSYSNSTYERWTASVTHPLVAGQTYTFVPTCTLSLLDGADSLTVTGRNVMDTVTVIAA